MKPTPHGRKEGAPRGRPPARSPSSRKPRCQAPAKNSEKTASAGLSPLAGTGRGKAAPAPGCPHTSARRVPAGQAAPGRDTGERACAPAVRSVCGRRPARTVCGRSAGGPEPIGPSCPARWLQVAQQDDPATCHSPRKLPSPPPGRRGEGDRACGGRGGESLGGSLAPPRGQVPPRIHLSFDPGKDERRFVLRLLSLCRIFTATRRASGREVAAGRVWGPRLKTSRGLLRRPSASHSGENQEINLRRRRGPSRREPAGRQERSRGALQRPRPGRQPTCRTPGGERGLAVPQRPASDASARRRPAPAGLGGSRSRREAAVGQEKRDAFGGDAEGRARLRGGPRARPGLARPGQGVVRPRCPSRAPPKPRGPPLERSRRTPCSGRGLGRFARLAGTSPEVRATSVPSRWRSPCGAVVRASSPRGPRAAAASARRPGPVPPPARPLGTRGAHRGAGCGPASSPRPALAASVSAAAGPPCGRGSERPPSGRTLRRALPLCRGSRKLALSPLVRLGRCGTRRASPARPRAPTSHRRVPPPRAVAAAARGLQGGTCFLRRLCARAESGACAGAGQRQAEGGGRCPRSRESRAGPVAGPRERDPSRRQTLHRRAPAPPKATFSFATLCPLMAAGRGPTTGHRQPHPRRPSGTPLLSAGVGSWLWDAREQGEGRPEAAGAAVTPRHRAWAPPARAARGLPVGQTAAPCTGPLRRGGARPRSRAHGAHCRTAAERSRRGPAAGPAPAARPSRNGASIGQQRDGPGQSREGGGPAPSGSAVGGAACACALDPLRPRPVRPGFPRGLRPWPALEAWAPLPAPASPGAPASAPARPSSAQHARTLHPGPGGGSAGSPRRPHPAGVRAPHKGEARAGRDGPRGALGGIWPRICETKASPGREAVAAGAPA
ncbi:collagen alpha-1(I) chain-like [Neovison vison]|uniref:collagen alpha-1(I) chain-like n=1 Tax=Neovison vison TaxID=452646 RepID=UPI001CF08641|nr:collagen alpha-1(I) chain-like [Neogale vison]